MGWRKVDMNSFGGWRPNEEGYCAGNGKETKEGAVDEDLFCFLKALCSIVYLL